MAGANIGSGFNPLQSGQVFLMRLVNSLKVDTMYVSFNPLQSGQVFLI